MYKPIENFIVRTPIFPTEYFLSLNHEKITDTIKNIKTLDAIIDPIETPNDSYKFITNALAVANYKFLMELSKTQTIKPIVHQTILKYLIRMSSRPTPFGLFTVTGIGNFDENKVNLRLSSKIRFRARPDISWITTLVNRLEENEAILRSLHLLANPALTYYDGRIFLNNLSAFENNTTKKAKSIKRTRIVAYTLKLLKKPIRYDLLIRRLSSKYAVDTDILKTLLKSLIKDSFIITDLRPPLYSSNPLLHIIKMVKGIKEIQQQLIKINKDINRLNRMQNKNFLDNIASIKADIDSLIGYEQEYYLRFENFIKHTDIILPKSIGYEVAEIAELLLRLTPNPDGSSLIRNYKEHFIDKYGEYQLVKLTDLFDSNIGLGSPYIQPKTLANISTRDTEVKDILLSNKVANAIHERSLIVKLNDEDISTLETWKRDNKNAPSSLNIYISICADNKKEILKGNYKLKIAPAGGNTSAISAFSRILDLIDRKMYKNINCIYDAEKRLAPKKILVELYSYPDYKQLSDIVIHKPIYKYILLPDQFVTKKTKYKVINLDNLYVGIRDGKFYIYDKKLKKEVEVHNTTLINEELLPDIPRFLLDVSYSDRKPILDHFYWRSANNLPFLPRLEFKKYILSPARWHINKLNAGLDFKDFESFSNTFNKYRARWNLPRFINIMGPFDNRLLIDLDNSEELNLLYLQLKKLDVRSVLSVEEALPLPKDSLVDRGGKLYMSEFIVPLIRQDEENIPNISKFNKMQINKIKSIDKSIKFKKETLRKWLYLKIFVAKDAQDNFIIDNMSKFVFDYTNNKNVRKWFFIRYADPEHQIRLRFNFHSGYTNSDLSKLYKWASDMVLRGLCSGFALDIYDRELVRYGGKEGICLAEDFFCIDSVLVLKLLQELNTKKGYDKVVMCAFSIEYLLSRFGMTFESRLDLYRKITNNEKYSNISEFKDKVEVLYENLAGSQITYKNLIETIVNSTPNLKGLDRKLDFIAKKLTSLQTNDKLSTSIEDIIRSYLHMHCNRVFGTDRVLELGAYILIKRAVEKLEHQTNKDI